MHMHLPISCLAAALLLLVHVAPAANAAPGTFVYAGCSPSRFAPNTAFESNLNSLLASISAAASSGGATYNSFTSAAAGREEAVSAAAPAPAPEQSATYGMYQCHVDLLPGECASCVRDTVARVGAACPNARAASLQSDGCFVRYYGARGGLVAGTGVVRADGDDISVAAYRRCSAGTSGDAGFLSARGAVLAELQQGVGAAATSSGGGTGGYKVSASGPVRGVAQCVGGVSASDCDACVSQAVAQLTGTCGTALAADVYQAQCSVRYWANGNYYRSSQGNSGDDVGRTLAIIIGIMAGLALLVVFISFLRKACN
ncbi:unnamed protein product [Urochloa decumbens]|uniref:Gnk2-homologous domain-containing protein n=1 Tax=Urochloa decumbens TaxID=240449 RepID=A0ABC8V9I5_9POAL